MREAAIKTSSIMNSTTTMGREAFRGEVLSGTGTGNHKRTLRRHSKEGFTLTMKKRPGPSLRLTSCSFASRGEIREAPGTRGHTFDIKGAAIPG